MSLSRKFSLPIGRIAELARLAGISRALAWQRLCIAHGLCAQCGKQQNRKGRLCSVCHVKHATAQKRYREEVA